MGDILEYNKEFADVCWEKARLEIENDKYHKILHILKTKECNIHALLLHLKRFDSPSGYNALVGDKYKLTEQEYDLLKEVLLWLKPKNNYLMNIKKVV